MGHFPIKSPDAKSSSRSIKPIPTHPWRIVSTKALLVALTQLGPKLAVYLENFLVRLLEPTRRVEIKAAQAKGPNKITNAKQEANKFVMQLLQHVQPGAASNNQNRFGVGTH